MLQVQYIPRLSRASLPSVNNCYGEPIPSAAPKGVQVPGWVCRVRPKFLPKNGSEAAGPGLWSRSKRAEASLDVSARDYPRRIESKK